MSTAPERASHDKSKTPLRSRLQKLRDDRKDEAFEPEMPPLEVGYLIGYLWEIGPVISSGMGAGPITHEGLQSWQALTGIELQPWEVRFLRRLSHEYLAESHRAEKADCPAPWTPVDTSQQDREAVSKKIQNAMRSLMIAQRKP